MDKIGVIGIIITDKKVVPNVQALLSEYGDIILGRMGIPDREHGIQAISIVVEGATRKYLRLVANWVDWKT